MKAIIFKVFLDPHNSYNALDRYRFLELLAAYGVGPRTLQILQTYWGRLNKVARVGGYFERPFMVYQGVTQGYPLSPTIFNMVLDAVIRHWVTVVTPTKVGMGGLGLTILNLVLYFYANNGLVAPTRP